MNAFVRFSMVWMYWFAMIVAGSWPKSWWVCGWWSNWYSGQQNMVGVVGVVGRFKNGCSTMLGMICWDYLLMTSIFLGFKPPTSCMVKQQSKSTWQHWVCRCNIFWSQQHDRILAWIMKSCCCFLDVWTTNSFGLIAVMVWLSPLPELYR